MLRRRNVRRLDKAVQMLAELDATRRSNEGAFARASAGTLAVRTGFITLSSPQPPLRPRAG